VKGKDGPLFEFYDPENPNRRRKKNDVRLSYFIAHDSIVLEELSHANRRNTTNTYTLVQNGNYTIPKRMYLPSLSILILDSIAKRSFHSRLDTTAQSDHPELSSCDVLLESSPPPQNTSR
jgi:hypothetical protein